jgi:2-isopropylmalate synthase
LAVANSLAAVQAGVRQVECTINGIGERAGNASLEEVVMALKVRRGYFKAVTGINTKEITRASRLVSSITGLAVQANKAIVGSNAFAHESGIHQDGVFKNRQTYEIMEPGDIGLNDNVIKLGPRSGRAGLKKRLAQLGAELDDKQLEKAYEAFLALADRKKDIYDDDLLTLLNPEKSTKGDYKLVELAVTAGTAAGATAKIVLEKDGKQLLTLTQGTGPVDAIFKGLQELTKTDSALVSYSLQAITGGTDAQADVTVVLEHKGKRASARAAHTDTLVASAEAYVAAINRMATVKDSITLGKKGL